MFSSGHGSVGLLPTETSCDSVKHLENIRSGINWKTDVVMTPLCGCHLSHLLFCLVFFVGFGKKNVDSSDCDPLIVDTFLLLL